MLKRTSLITAAALTMSGCVAGYIGPQGAVVYPGPILDTRQKADIPPGHRPPPGSCRVWFPDRPPGQQPPPGPCDLEVPRGATLIRG